MKAIKLSQSQLANLRFQRFSLRLNSLYVEVLRESKDLPLTCHFLQLPHRP